ncbi:hypothetical protein [uncultured Desulfosarcina sp.]|uniref:hypothetical protein n=1 Tax=uncultured Desulfosarcina sp. TaxID=218289 RepID=UPI0029C90C66|nr:hypothetical protein [uncultured Desulfosarcina sp.]
MADSSGSAGGGSIIGYLTPLQETQDPIIDLKKLAAGMLRQAILDIGRPRLQTRTLLWVNDDHPDAGGWVTAFGTVCWLLGRDANLTRRMLNRFAASGMTLERILARGRIDKPGNTPGKRKKTKRKRSRT